MGTYLRSQNKYLYFGFFFKKKKYWMIIKMLRNGEFTHIFDDFPLSRFAPPKNDSGANLDMHKNYLYIIKLIFLMLSIVKKCVNSILNKFHSLILKTLIVAFFTV